MSLSAPSDASHSNAAAATESTMSPEEEARMRASSRESRLSFRNFAESQLRRDLKEEAMEICDPQIKAFAECSQKSGLLNVFYCQGELKGINECLAIHNGPEAWEKYKRLHEEDIKRKAQPWAYNNNNK
jgi:Cytochrome c oxidase biogenesis protein Cmc1 like